MAAKPKIKTRAEIDQPPAKAGWAIHDVTHVGINAALSIAHPMLCIDGEGAFNASKAHSTIAAVLQQKIIR